MASIGNSTLTRRQFARLATSALTAGALSAIAPLTISAAPQAAHASQEGTTLIYAIAGDPGSSVNFVTTSDRYGLMTLKAVFSPLLTMLPDGTVNYLLAESYEVSSDNLTYTVHLREGARWHDGTPVTADDVVFTFETIRDTPTANGSSNLNFGAQGQVNIEAIDDQTVVFTFPFLNPAGLESAIAGKFVAPRHVYEGVTNWENNDVNTHPVGSSPYTLAEYLPGQYLKFSANEDYVLGAPDIETIIYQIITNETTGQLAIQAGEVDAWIGTPAQIEQLDLQAGVLTVTPYSEGRVAYLDFNAARVTNENIRRAFFLSLDKRAIAQAALLDETYYELVYSFLPPVNSFYTDNLERYERDIDTARALLEQEGQPAPHFTCAYSSGDTLQATAALMIQEQAAEAGFNLELVGLDATALTNAMKDSASPYDLYFGGYIMGVDPSTYDTIFKSDATWNYIHYDQAEYPTIDELFNQGAIETDPERRRQIYNDLQAAIANTATFYPLYSNQRLLVTTAKVGGIEEAQLVPIYTFEDLSKLTVA